MYDRKYVITTSKTIATVTRRLKWSVALELNSLNGGHV